MTREEILRNSFNKYRYASPLCGQTEPTVYEAMEQYAKQEAIGFILFALKRQLELSLGIICDNDGTYDSIEEYYQKYLQHSENQSKNQQP